MSGFFWLVSYPKSGSTWLALALSSVAQGGIPIEFGGEAPGFPQAAARDTFDAVLGIESSDLTPEEDERLRPSVYRAIASNLDQPVIRRVHSAFVKTTTGDFVFPPDLTLGAIYLTRDPRDVAVSYAHYVETTIDGAIAIMGTPAASLGARLHSISPLLRQRLLTWSDHVESWMDAGVRTLHMRYEDMILDPADALSKAASFLNWKTRPDVIASAVEATRFERLQSQEREHGFESGGRTRLFFRRGLAGGWRDSLTPDQIRAVERDHGRVMTRVGYPLTAAL